MINIKTLESDLDNYSIEKNKEAKKQYLVINNKKEVLAKIYVSADEKRIEKIDFNINSNDLNFKNIFCSLYNSLSVNSVIEIEGNVREWSCGISDKFYFAVIFNLFSRYSGAEENIFEIQSYIIYSIKIACKTEIDLIKIKRGEDKTLITQTELKLEKEQKELSDLKKLLKKAQENLQIQNQNKK